MEKLGNLLKVTQLVSGGAEDLKPGILAPKPGLLSSCYYPSFTNEDTEAQKEISDLTKTMWLVSNGTGVWFDSMAHGLSL